MFALTKRQIQFAYQVAEDPEASATTCAKRAGYAESSAAEMACLNLKNTNVLETIDRRRAELAAAAGITPEAVLREWWSIATSDPNDLVTLVKKRCPLCWEIDEPDLPVNALCRTCAGEGITIVRLSDSGKLNGPARRLFAGAKQTQYGIEVKLRDQDAAWRNLADYLGMLNKSKGELSGPGGGPIPLLHATPADLSDEQLLAIAAAGGATLGVAVGVSSPAALPMTIDAMV